MKNTLRLWVGVLAIGFRFLPLSLFFWRRQEKKRGGGLIMGNQKFRDAMMGLTLWGRSGHLRCAKEKHDLFGLVCGGVFDIVFGVHCGENLGDEAGLWWA